jgi:hypothetical protein
MLHKLVEALDGNNLEIAAEQLGQLPNERVKSAWDVLFENTPEDTIAESAYGVRVIT